MTADTRTELAIDTLAGDLHAALVGHLRDMKRPWTMMTEAEQRDKIAAMDMAARELVRGTVRLLTNHEFPHTAVTLGEVKIKGEKGIEAKITCANIDHNRAVLGEHVGQMITVLMVDSETFMASRRPVDAAPDQGGLPGVA
jgi:GTPase Era involved in 16S rRNA processing